MQTIRDNYEYSPLIHQLHSLFKGQAVPRI